MGPDPGEERLRDPEDERLRDPGDERLRDSREEPARRRQRARGAWADAVEAQAPSPMAGLAAALGNRAFSGALARSPLAREAEQGAGIRDDGTVHPEVQEAIDAKRGGGSALDPGVAGRMAGTLGDLSDVRVHTDDAADRLSRSVSARAFATGTDVYFARGEYAPGSTAGERLIAHELAHVVQQRGSAAGGPLTVSQPGDPAELEADAVAGEL